MTDAMHIPALGLLSRTLQLLFGMLVSGEIERGVSGDQSGLLDSAEGRRGGRE